MAPAVMLPPLLLLPATMAPEVRRMAIDLDPPGTSAERPTLVYLRDPTARSSSSLPPVRALIMSFNSSSYLRSVTHPSPLKRSISYTPSFSRASNSSRVLPRAAATSSVKRSAWTQHHHEDTR